MKQKKDILFLCQFFHPEYISSAQLPFDTAKVLAQAGFSVEVLCGEPKEYYHGPKVPKTETVEGITIHRLHYLQPDRSKPWGRVVNYFSFTLSVFFHLGSLRNYRCALFYSNPPVLPWVASWEVLSARESKSSSAWALLRPYRSLGAKGVSLVTVTVFPKGAVRP